MRRALIAAIVLQGLGAALTLLTSVSISWVGGAEIQGRFALYKSWYDVETGLLLFGVPSAIVLAAARGPLNVRVLYRQTLRLCLFALPALAILHAAILPLFFSPNLIDGALFGSAIALSLGYAIVRALLLTLHDGVVFSAVTALPGLVLFVAATIAVADGIDSFGIVYLAVAFLSFTVSVRLLLRLAPAETQGLPSTGLPGFAIFSASAMHIFLQSVLFGLQPFLTFQLLSLLGAPVATLGVFSLATVLITAPNLAIAMVAPILLRRWSQGLSASALSLVRRRTIIAAGAAQALALAGLVLVPHRLRASLEREFPDLSMISLLLLVGLFPLVCTRILTPALLGTAMIKDLSVSCAARLAAVAVLIPVAWLLQFDLVRSAAVSWACGEWLAFAILWLGWRSHPELGVGARLLSAK